MAVKRFDFGKLTDFRRIPDALDIVHDETNDNKPTVPEAPPPPPTFTEVELKLAKQSSFEEGRRSGIEEGIAQANTEGVQRERTMDTALKSIVTQAREVHQRHHELMRLQCEELSGLVMVVAHKVAGDAMKHVPAASVETMVRDCLNIIMHQPKITLTVHPSIETLMRIRIDALTTQLGEECHLRIITDESISPSEGKLEWKDGIAERNLSRIWPQIEAMVNAIDFTKLADTVHLVKPEAASHEEEVFDMQVALIPAETGDDDEPAMTKQTTMGEQ